MKPESLPSYLPYAAGLLSLISIVFNVGFFSGVGSGFFTLFSIQDHILFALQSLPAVIFLTLITLALFAALSVHYGRRSEFASPYETLSRIRSPAVPATAFLLIALLVIAIIVWRDDHRLFGLAGLSLMLSATFQMVRMKAFFERSEADIHKLLVNAMIALDFLQLVFVYGSLLGIIMVNALDKGLRYTITPFGGEPVILLRSGQEGVLAARGDGTIIYVSREEIDQIERRQ